MRCCTRSSACRELAFQLADQFRALGAGMSFKDCVVVGGLDMQQQVSIGSQCSDRAGRPACELQEQ